MQLTVYRNGESLTDFEIDDRTVFTQKLMGEHKIVSDFIASAPLPVQIGDYIVHDQERFYINTSPEVEKINNFTYRYVIEFEGEIYRMYNKIFMDEGVADFSYHGSPEDFLLLLLTNMNSIDGGWAIEQVAEAPSQTLTFNEMSCRQALTTIAEAFGLEYRLVNKNIYLERSVGFETTIEFEYGPGRGLYNLTRNKIEEKNVVTRVYGFGARKNINYDYRDGLSRLVFQERHLERNTELYGIREGSVTFDDVFPQRTGTISGIDPEDRLFIADADLDFNINDYLLEGVTAKIVFKTGALTGYEFEIETYRHSDRKIKFIEFIEENGYTLPNNLNFPEVGDEYTLVGIKMPQLYIDEAESTLKERAQTYLEENSVPRVIYNLELDEKYIRERGIALKVADIVRVFDEALGINNDIRVASLSYPLVNQDLVTATIADSIPYTFQEKTIADNIDTSTEIRNVDEERIELARRSALRFKKLQSLIADPDGYFDPTNIKPSSIETLMLSVGARSQNFGLIGVKIEANAESNSNILKISGGKLVHYTIEIEGLGYVWELDPRTFTGLDPEKHYYVYALASATSLTGTWEISEEPRRVDDVEGHYIFNLGILYAVEDGRRDFDFTNGMTYINGDTITTGRIKSLDGLNFFDLSQGKFKIGNDESSLDYNVTKEGQLTLKGVLVSSMIFADDAAIERLSVRSLRTADEGRRLEILESGNNMILYDDDGRETLRIDDGIDANLGGVRANNPLDGRFSNLTGVGMYTNGSRLNKYTEDYMSTGRYSTDRIISSMAADLERREYGIISSAVSGYNPFNRDNCYGGMFYGGLRVEGGYTGLDIHAAIHMNPRIINDEDNYTTLGNSDNYVSCYNNNSLTIYLPRNPKKGRIIYIRRNIGGLSVYSRSIDMVREGVVDSVGINRGDEWSFFYDGGNWLCNFKGRT